MSTASRGRALEHEVIDIFRQAGYAVIRGAGSKGELAITEEGPMKVDLVASRVTPGLKRTVYIIGVQCKLKTRK